MTKGLVFSTARSPGATNCTLQFHSGLSVVSEGCDYFVQAFQTIAHGDTKTQAVRKEFMGLLKDEVGQLMGLFDNMYGRWCVVRREDGMIVDCRAEELNLISEELYKALIELSVARKRLAALKPTLFEYKTSREKELPDGIKSDVPIVKDSCVLVKGTGGKQQAYQVIAVMHEYTSIEGQAVYTGTHLTLDSIPALWRN